MGDRFKGDGWLVLALALAAGSLVMLRRAWIISEEKGVPIFSSENWEEFRIYLGIAAAFIAIRVIWFIATRRRDIDEDGS